VSNSNNIPEKDKKLTDISQRSRPRKIEQVHRLARQAGLFLYDRDLLSCDSCGLLEDVDINGRLITYKSGEAVLDSGMRFERGEGNTHVCPVCGAPARER
jgi:rubrerythrin